MNIPTVAIVGAGPIGIELAIALKRRVLDLCRRGLARVFTDRFASPTGFPFKVVPLEETLRALNEAVERGKVKYLGVSNFDRDLLEQARRHAETPIVTDQVPYSLFNRRYAKNGTLAYCQENDILLMAYTPVDHSELMRSDLVRELAEKYDATPHQIALSWLVRQPKVITIPKSENVEHMRENLASVELEISEEDARRLTEMR